MQQNMLVEALMEKNHLTGEEIDRIFSENTTVTV